ncbi:hypothetical protein PIB30_029701 [Stylosanthes scabra]|uniref:DUF4283 domain-containing protein n=1 Tax=Stylosanthes scabra TaxID=79078 RepID=A0ABU6WEX2_9FABA|nr:hypothetical protein [Stylosanthes scabra]
MRYSSPNLIQFSYSSLILIILRTDHRGLEDNPNEASDEDLVVLEASDIKQDTEDFSKNLVGRIMSDRSFSLGIIEGAFIAIWNYPEGFKIKNHGDNFIIHVRRWNRDDSFAASDFSIILMWIQLWNLPDFCKTKEAATKIGEKMGSIIDVDLFEMRPRDLKIMKIRVKVDVTSTLRQSIRIASPEKKHLKADQNGWRITASKENNDPNWRGRTPALNRTKKKPTPVSLIKSFANLTCSDDNMRRTNREEDNISSTLLLISDQQNNHAPNDVF